MARRAQCDGRVFPGSSTNVALDSGLLARVLHKTDQNGDQVSDGHGSIENSVRDRVIEWFAYGKHLSDLIGNGSAG